ncbi:MAG: CDP-alcohol phosphatidyltransferase family protein [Candidatus Hermodarchaeota archaeon]
MPSKFRIRYLFRPIINRIAKSLIKIGITPNLATTIMFFFSILCFIALTIFGNILLFSISVFITGIMDGCDGAIARLTNKSTEFGGFFDSIMDRFSEFFIFLGLYLYTQSQTLWNLFDMKLIVLLSFLASIMISYTRARAEVFFKEDFDLGLMARSERLFYLVIVSLISFFYDFFNFFLFVFMWLVIATFLFRIAKIYIKMKSKDNEI